MKLEKILYSEYEKDLPQEGKHIVGQLKGDSIFVYQAFNNSIANYAVAHQRFGGSSYKFERMSWIKPNFLWMMYRSGWAQKENQERILAIEISKENFEKLLEMAVYSTFQKHLYETPENWKNLLKTSEVRLQWDPDHGPKGNKLNRRAVQLGLRGEMLKSFATDWVRSIQDITPFVLEQYAVLKSEKPSDLEVIKEKLIPQRQTDIT